MLVGVAAVAAPARARRSWGVLGLWSLVVLAGCEREAPEEQPLAAASSESAPPWEVASNEAKPPPGMVRIPQGPLVVGTPPDRLPRIADEEMPGQQVIMKEFFIDRFAYPNEPGAIPLTNVSLQEARALCERSNKRLCTELEWERACKGPNNTTYSYGETYRPELCRTGDGQMRTPSGYLIGCASGFGVNDLHGGSWEWTDSTWGRGSQQGLATLRGGDGQPGEVVGRCANARAQKPNAKSSEIGLRCCSGPRNELEVSLDVVDGTTLVQRGKVDRQLAKILEERLPDAVAERMRQRGTFRILRMWEWRPIGNEELLISGGCAGAERFRRCGVTIARESVGRLQTMAWADSGFYIPTVRVHGPRTSVWVYGGDAKSHFTRRVDYAWGRVVIGEIDRDTKPLADSSDKRR